MICVTHMETRVRYYMDAKTPYEALTKMKYTLDLKRKDDKATINKTTSGMHLYLDHGGNTYAVRNG